ncbi:LamG domain-containing protein [Flavitalea antarctica]
MKKYLLISLFTFPVVVAAQLPSGAIAQYPFDNTLADISGNAYDGSLASTSAAPNRFGVAGRATSFTAGSSSGQLPGTLQTAIRGNFSLGYWFNTSMTASSSSQWYGGNAMVDAEVCGGTTDWGTALIDGGKVAFGIGGDITIKSPLDYNNGAWHFVTVTRNQSVGTFKLFVDGIEVASNVGIPNDLVAAPFIGIGRNPCNPAPLYTGLMDDIIVYDRTLSGTEVQDLYNSSLLFTLPLKWLEFKGLEQNKMVTLKWTVANMTNTQSFEVESSKDGQHFHHAGSVRANAGISDYTYQVPGTTSTGNKYFRIRQVDNDGKFSYSAIILVREEPK